MEDFVVPNREVSQELEAFVTLLSQATVSEEESDRRGHAMGQTMVDTIPDMVSLLTEGAEVVADPEIEAALLEMADAMEELQVAFGTHGAGGGKPWGVSDGDAIEVHRWPSSTPSPKEGESASQIVVCHMSWRRAGSTSISRFPES